MGKPCRRKANDCWNENVNLKILDKVLIQERTAHPKYCRFPPVIKLIRYAILAHTQNKKAQVKTQAASKLLSQAQLIKVNNLLAAVRTLKLLHNLLLFKKK